MYYKGKTKQMVVTEMEGHAELTVGSGFALLPRVDYF